MAVELATGYISLVPSARGFRAAVARELGADLAAAGGDAGARASRSFGSRFTAGVADVGKTAGLALGIGLGAAGTYGIKVAADFEQTTIAFEGLLGSADKAQTLLTDLRDFAARTPFEFPGLAQASRRLLAVGFSAGELIPVMTRIGNVAATLGVGQDSIDGVIRALGQIKGKGKVASQELIQISEAIPGFSAIDAVAKSMGVTTAEAFKLVENGAVSAEVGIAAVLEGMEKFPGAAGAMDRQSKTLNGVISTFKDTLSATAIDFITPYLPAISSGVRQFGQFISGTAVPALKDLIDFISRDVVPPIESLVRVFSEQGLGGLIEELGRRFREALPGIRTALSDIAVAFGEWIVQNAPEFGRKLLELGGKLVAWVAPQIPPLLLELGKLMVSVGAWILSDGVPLLVEKTQELASALVRWVLTDALPGIIRALPGFVSGVVRWLDEEAVPEMIDAGKKLGGALVEGFFDSIKGVFGDSFDFLGKAEVSFDIPFVGRASGGPVNAGQTYIVGERGPELFRPDVAGTIIPEVPSGFGSTGPLIGSLQVVQVSGEDPVMTAMRELKRVQLLAA